MKRALALATLLFPVILAWGQSPAVLGPAIPGTPLAVLSSDEGRVLANKHLQRPPNAGCFLEERNGCWFVAPPYLDAGETERAGVYVVKQSGRVLPFYPIDAAVLEGMLTADGISAEQAKALVQQYLGRKPTAAYPLDDRQRDVQKLSARPNGNYWVLTPIVIKTSVHFYVDRYTGKVTGKCRKN